VLNPNYFYPWGPGNCCKKHPSVSPVHFLSNGNSHPGQIFPESAFLSSELCLTAIEAWVPIRESNLQTWYWIFYFMAGTAVKEHTMNPEAKPIKTYWKTLTPAA
jgi:hypothetical protein